MTPVCFESFYGEMYPRLCRGLPRIFGDVYDTEDIVQDTLNAVWRNWKRVSTCESPQTWTWRVALNLHKKRAKRSRREHEQLAVQLGPASTATAETPPDDRLWAAVASLPYSQRTTLVLRHIDDLTYSQISEILGCSAVSARQHHARGKAKLRLLVPQTAPDG